MTQQDKLFVFIQSLTRAEKSYFTKYARLNSAKEKPDYLLLFDYLSEVRTYDEVVLKKHFKGEKFINQLARKKTQLKDKIMESLSHYHANHTVEASLRLQMNLLPPLYDKAKQNKALLKEYENQVKKIKQAAEKEECFEVLIDLFRWERRLFYLRDAPKADKSTLLLLEERETFQNRFNQELDTEKASISTELILMKDPKVEKQESLELFQNTVTPILRKHQPENLSRMAKRYYLYAKTGHHCFSNQWKSAHSVAKQLIETYSEKDIEDAITMKYYKEHLCRYLVLSYRADNLDDYPEVIAKLKLLSSDNDDVKMFNTIQSKMLIYHLDRHEFKEALVIVKKIEHRWDDLCNVIERRRQLAYYYNIMVTYWFCDEIDTALYWLSKILNFENVQRGQAFVAAARVMQIPMYYDVEDINLENRVDSTRKVLRKREELSEYRQIILSGFRQLIRCIDKSEKSKCIVSMYQNLLKIKDEQSLKEMDLEGVLLWSKLKIPQIDK